MLRTIKTLITLQLSIILTLNTAISSTKISSSESTQNLKGVNLSKFEKPFCMVGNGKYNQKNKKKLKTIRKYQRKISRKTKDFKKNKKKEKGATLHGSPKWVAIKWLRNKKYNWKEVNFAFYAMTLFAEAKNLDEKSMGMVAKVINNRKKKKNYINTVTNLAQFSSWYYKNQRDNVVLLCPDKKYHKHWKKSVKVAAEHFNKKDPNFRSTHYFAPRNMVPRYRLPSWAKGKHVVGYGGHIFIVKKSFDPPEEDKEVIFIPRKAKKAKVVRGKIYL